MGKALPPATTIRVPTHLAAKVSKLAAERGCFQRRILEEALTQYLEKLSTATR